ncbi:hypothetical protein CYQ88_02920 [Hydrogenovibrio sp. SC-1]|nr:hypothetical protein CYQ88_02920 [Hydrogenovibrio sp. SC-1]
MPSTPLNILVATAHALAHAESQCSSLVLIDQKNIEHNPYIQALDNWQGSPFQSLSILPGQQTGWKKLRERRQSFKSLKALLDKISPQAIAVSSDRRIEFQFAMQYQRQHQSCIGVYLDDGLYSYAGRRTTALETILGRVAKKLAYGAWWNEPVQVGSSSWIDQAWLFQPDSAITDYQQKSIYALRPEWFASEPIQELGLALFSAMGASTTSMLELKEVDVCLLIAHPNNILKMQNYQQKVEDFILALTRRGLKVAIKYHPRVKDGDPLNLKERVGFVIPSQLAFEFVLPQFKDAIMIVGDVGTSVLTAKWLKSQSQVYAVLYEDDPFQLSFAALFSQLGVAVVPTYQAIFDND